MRPDAIEMLPKIVRHYGEPFADASAIPSFYLAELTRSEHVTVALNGDGGDESFGGYTRYVANRLGGRFDRLPLCLRRAVAARAARLGGGEVTSLSNKVRRIGQGLPLDPAGRYERYMSWSNDAERAQLYSDDFAAAVSPHARRRPHHRVRGRTPREAMWST